MGSFIPINQIDSNQSFYYEISTAEKEINLLGKDQESKPTKKSLLKSFLSLFRRMHKEKILDREIKEGIVALKIGETYHAQGNVNEAKNFFSISRELLKQSPSLKSYSEEELKKLDQ